ncbi:MAG: hypothetical protein OEZ06_22310 [Myxococcales bacterium]|nr:hypothetical protein [Myxococcales bacterium]
MDPIAGEVKLGPGWAAFAEPEHYLHYAAILCAATLSGAIIAYHPVHRGRPLMLEDLEQRKTLIIYSVVGALIAIICSVNPSMAFVIFGIGGLLRFRTDVGASKHTGHTIMGALIGLCWGLGLELVAVFATGFFWVMVYVLELSSVVELNVGGVAVAQMAKAAEAYRVAIEQAGARLTAQRKNFKKPQMSFVMRLPRGCTVEDVARRVAEIPEELRGTPDWPE